MSASPDSKVSIIVPILNEENHIESMVKSLLADDETSKELLLVDGGSTDGTWQLIGQLSERHKEIRCISNPERFVSQGFNKAFGLSSGVYIAFLGAHAIYPDKFFTLAVQYLSSMDCDAVGGPLKQLGRTRKGKAIAYSMSQPFGVGNTEFRTMNELKYVDSVAFAVYKRSVFEKIGLLDLDLVRNQDDEFHYRMNAEGLKILMVPELQCIYYVREDFRSLFRQYFEYGLYKPKVLLKVKQGFRIRHLVPAGFVLYVLSLPVLLTGSIWLGLPLVVYVASVSAFAIRYKAPLLERSYAFLSFLTLHIAYGAGFLIGLFRLKSNAA